MVHIRSKDIDKIIQADQEKNVVVYEFQGIKFVVTTLIAYERDTKTSVKQN